MPLDTQETLSKFDLLIKEIQDVIDAPAERSFQQEKQKQLLQLEITAEEEKRKHTRELEKEREAWMIQLDELKVKEEKAVAAQKQEYMAQIEKQRLAQELEIQKEREIQINKIFISYATDAKTRSINAIYFRKLTRFQNNTNQTLINNRCWSATLSHQHFAF